MKRLLIAATAALFLAGPSLALADSIVINAHDFAGVDLSSGIVAELNIGPRFSVVAESPVATDLSDLRYSVSGGVLHVWYDWNVFRLLDPAERQVKLTITLPALASIDASSGARLTAVGTASPGALRVDASSGAGVIVSAASARSYMLDASSGSSISIWGSCESVNADASSGAGIEAIELTCSNAAIDASEGAHVRLTAHASLRADVSSGGGIDVFGRPQATDVDSSSGGSIAFLE